MAEIADAIGEVTPEAPPVVGAPPVEAPPAEPEAPATPAVEAPAPAPEYGWIEEAGGADAVKEAWEFRQALKTEEGITDAFVEFGVALGLTPAQLAGLFPEEAAALAAADEELDKPMTKREAEEYVQQLIADQVLAPLEARDEAQAAATISSTLVSTLDQLEVPEGDREFLLKAFADKHVPEGKMYDPEAVKAAVVQGKADYDAWLEAQVQARLDAKGVAAAGLPKPLTGGTTGGGEASPEPMSMAEAKARVRAQHGGR